MNLPQVTVVTPLYNYETFIDRCIESVLSQTYPHVDMIVIDDGSTDQGPERVLKYKDKGVKLLRQKRNAYGVSRAMNTAIEQAQGELIQWLSADDYFAPQKIEKCVRAFLDAPPHQWAGVHTDLLIETRDQGVLLDPKTPFGALAQHNQDFVNTLKQHGSVGLKAEAKPQTPGEFMKNLLFHGPQINGCALLAPKEVYQGVGGFQECWSLTHDTELWARMALKGYAFLPLNEALVISEHHETNSNRYRWDVPAELNILTRYLALLLDFNLVKDAYSGLYSEWCWDLIQHFVKIKAWDSVAFWLPRYRKSGGDYHKVQHIVSLAHERLPQNLQAPQTRAVGFAIYVTHRDTWRIKDVLTQYFKAFSTENIPLYIGLSETELQSRVQEQIEYALSYLGLSPSQLQCPIHFLDGPEPSDLLKFAVYFIPLADQTEWETRCLYAFQNFGQVVYNPEAPVLKRFAKITPALKDIDNPQSLHWAMHLHSDAAIKVSQTNLIQTQDGLYQLHPNPFETASAYPQWATHPYVASQFETAKLVPPALLGLDALHPSFPEHILGPPEKALICFWLNTESAPYLLGALRVLNSHWADSKLVLLNNLGAQELDVMVNQLPTELELEVDLLELSELNPQEYLAMMAHAHLLILAFANGKPHQNLVNDILTFQGANLLMCHEYDSKLGQQSTHFPLLTYSELLGDQDLTPDRFEQIFTACICDVKSFETLKPEQVYKHIRPRLSPNAMWPEGVII